MRLLQNRFLRELLITTLVLIGVAFFWLYQYDIREDHYVATVRENLKKTTQVMLDESKRTMTFLKEKDIISFENLPLDSEHPYFIFENKQLVFWSDYRFVPDYEFFNGNYKFKFINLKNGKYVFHKRVFTHKGKQIEVFSILQLYKKYEINSKYLKSGFNTDIIPDKFGVQLGNDASSSQSHKLYAADGTFIVSLELSPTVPYHPVNLLTIFVFCVLIAGCVWVIRWLKLLIKGGQFELGGFVLLFYMAFVRWFMVEFNLPFNLFETDLFDSKFYASSAANQSLGDLLLNAIGSFIWALYFLKYFFHSKTYYFLSKLPDSVRLGICILFTAISFFLLAFPYFFIQNIYLHSQGQIEFDITQSLNFPGLRVFFLITFLVVSCTCFVVTHLLCSFTIRMFFGRKKLLLIGLSGTVLFILISYFFGTVDYFLTISCFLYLILMFFFRLPQSLYRIRYVTSLYLFTGALICASSGAYGIYVMNRHEQNEIKRKYGLQWLSENDPEAEFLLNEAKREIKEDYFIKVKLLGLLPNSQLIEQKVRRVHLNPYFNKYNINVMIFNGKGENISKDTVAKSNYWNFVINYKKDQYKTNYEDVYFTTDNKDVNVIKQYVTFVRIDIDTANTGYIILDLKQKRISPTNVYPELLIDKNSIESPDFHNYDYGIFKGNKLVESSGSYNYQNLFPVKLFENPEISQNGVVENGMHHFLIRGKKYNQDFNQVVVTSPPYQIKHIFANLSFLFLLLVLIAILVIIFYNVASESAAETGNFSTKIQIYLNLAFFLPLFLVSIVMLNSIIAANRISLTNTFMSKARSVSENIGTDLDRYYEGDISEDTLSAMLSQLANYSEADINLFDKTGSLILSSQPLIYQKEVLSHFINPKALIEIVEKNNKEIMIPESVGDLNYNSVYVGVKGINSERLGIVSIPFFTSQAESERQIRELLSTVLNIFTALFIVFLLLSYFASRILTVPLRVIAQKLTKTSLNQYNEPLQWNTDDEIGLLVGEYNKMLVNLEESKKALSQTEKESAWREMAQQVAHEIKNPLTPMKLTLQHLKRTLFRDDGLPLPAMEKSLNTLLEQVDTLSDIATSFSTFAKMPTPKDEKFDIMQVLKQTLDLYVANENVDIKTDFKTKTCFVKADDQLMSRIFTNIILNGIQSVPVSRKASLNIMLKEEKSHVLITIKDNGSGIPKDIQDKVFNPNFSTKYSGSGIGLAVAKRGVENSGGSIWFETEENKGTTFFIKLPLV